MFGKYRVKGWLMLVAWLGTLFSGCSSKIPAVALSDIQPGSEKQLEVINLAADGKQSAIVGKLALIEVKRLDGNTEYRAYLESGHQNSEALYMGALSQQFPDAPFQSIAFIVGGAFFIVGRINDSFTGTLDSIDFERVEPDRTRWMEAVKSILIRKRLFALPIGADEQAQWQTIARIAIKTKESLAAGWNRTAANGSAWEQSYQPPIPVVFK